MDYLLWQNGCCAGEMCVIWPTNCCYVLPFNTKLKDSEGSKHHMALITHETVWVKSDT